MNIKEAILTRKELLYRINHDALVQGLANPSKDVGDSYIDVRLCDILGIERMDQPIRRVDDNGKAEFILPVINPMVDKVPLILHDITGGFLVQPHTFIMGALEETINNAKDLTGLFLLDSTVARCGIQHSLAIGVIPGWSGRLALELTISLQWHQILLTGKMPIGKLIFFKHDEVKGYNGKYNNQKLFHIFGPDIKPTYKSIT